MQINHLVATAKTSQSLVHRLVKLAWSLMTARTVRLDAEMIPNTTWLSSIASGTKSQLQISQSGMTRHGIETQLLLE
jgi:hypothetical protein